MGEATASASQELTEADVDDKNTAYDIKAGLPPP